MPKDQREAFFSTGIEYYVTARFSACAGLTLVCGNLFHHTVEMLLKGFLSSRLDLSELKKLGHRLQDIWNRFKLECRDDSLNRFDRTVAQLDKFETIRYPDRILSEGMITFISFARGDATGLQVSPSRPEPVYELFVGEIDSLVRIIFQKSSINPTFFTNSMNAEARTYLDKWNDAPLG